MKAAVLNKVKDIEVKELEMPECGEGQVLIKVQAVGLCGSDIHYFENGRVGPYVVKEPIILGHEASGEIVKAGDKVRSLEAGQRVSIEPGMTCKNCKYCLEGRYNLCPHVEFLATPPYDGAFCEYIAMREDVVFPIPDDMSYYTAALIEPFSVGLHAVNRGNVVPGDTVVIMGMGPIGMMTAAAAKIYGAARIIGVDLEANRLEIARKFGVTDTINISEQDIHSELNKLTDGEKADVSIETAGNAKAVASAIDAVKRGGRVTVVGLPPEDFANINISQIVDGEIDIKGVFRYHHTYEKAIKLLNKTDINLEEMVSGFYTLEQTEEAFHKAIGDKKGTMKLIVEPNK